MWDRTRIHGAALAAALGLLVAGGARAQVLEGRTCVDAVACDNPGEPCGDGTGTCVARDGGLQPYCLPHDSAPCCQDSTDCPLVMRPLTCRSVPGLTSGGEPAGLCLDAGAEYCDGTLETILQCHTFEGGGGRLPWPEGDCDRDGTPNGADPGPCNAPLNRGIDDGTGVCSTVVTGCNPEAPCPLTFNGGDGFCEPSEDGHGFRCFPDSETAVLYCAGGVDRYDCFGDETVVALGDASYCVPGICGRDDPGVDIVRCIKDGDGRPVPWDEGDCDGDGERNGDEANSPERDPCVDESVTPPGDAGAIEPTDAGDPRVDGGGATIDGGPGGPENPRFEGGGGCACRTSSAPSRAPVGILLLLGVALALRSRSRRG